MAASDTVSVKPNGELTHVDYELSGKRLAIGVTRQAIEDYLRLSPDAAAKMTNDERADFVRSHLPIIIAAVRRKLEAIGSDADVIVLRTGEL